MPGETQDILHSRRLRRSAPLTLAGYDRFRHVVNADGALPAPIKGLFVAVAAIVKRYEDMAQRELARAKEIGLSLDHANAGVVALCSSRGEGAALAFQAMVDEVYGPDDQPMPEPAERKVADGEARENFLKYFGEMPPSLGALVDDVPLAADAYYLMREGTLGGSAIGAKHAELLLVTVLAADYNALVSVHAAGALRAGASRAELYEAILCAVPVAGLSGWVAAYNAIDAAERSAGSGR